MVMQFINGFALGYEFMHIQHGIDEFKQGEHGLFLASMIQASQVTTLANIIFLAAEKYPPWIKIPLHILCNVVPVCHIALPVSHLIHEGYYEAMALQWNQRLARWKFVTVPRRLSPSTLNMTTFVSKNLNKGIRITAFFAAISILGSRNYLYGLGIITACISEIAIRHFFMFRRVRIYSDMYLPLLAKMTFIVQGVFISRLINFYKVITHYRPLNFYVQNQVSCFARYLFGWEKGIALSDIDADWVKNREFTAAQILEILGGRDEEYEINPAHCSKPILGDHLPCDRDFQKLLVLFDRIDWTKKTSLLLPKLKDDTRFRAFMRTQLEKKGVPVQNDFQRDLQNLTNGLSTERFLAHWTRRQMADLVAILKREKPVEGDERVLEEAISKCSRLIPHLITCKDKTHVEDALLQLSIEGGNYCAIEIRRTMGKLLDEFETIGLSGDPLKVYEFKILRTLELWRLAPIEAVYGAMSEWYRQQTGGFAQQFSSSMLSNLHIFESYKGWGGLGFVPLTTYERDLVSLFEIVFATFNLSKSMPEIYNDYIQNLDGAVTYNGEIYFGTYIPALIHSMKITPTQKEDLIERFIDPTNPEKTKHIFKRLMFVRLGVLRRK